MKISKVIETLASFSIKIFGWNIGYNSQLTLISYATNIQQVNDAPSAKQTLQAEQMRTWQLCNNSNYNLMLPHQYLTYILPIH